MSNRVLRATIIVLASLVGCVPPEGGDKAAESRHLVGAVFQTLNNPFFAECNEGIKEVVEAHGDRLVTLDSQWSEQKQSKDISDLIGRGASAVFINPVHWEGITESLLKARQKGIPCVVVDAPVKDAELVLCQVASDNVEAGRMAARALAKVRPRSRIVILHISPNKACIDRVDGFKSELAKWPDMQVLDVRHGQGTVEGSRPVMQELLGKYPALNAVFAVNDPSASGAISAIEAAGRLGDVTVVSVDGSPEGIVAVQAGRLYSTSAQFPREIGRIAAQRVYEYLDGNPVEKDIKVPLELITPDNVNAFARKR